MTALLEKQRKAKEKRDEAFAKAEKSEGVEKAKLLVEALKLVPPTTVFSAYGKTIDEIAKLDPDDKTGFVKKAQAEQAQSALEEGFGELMEAGKSDEAIKHIDEFIAKHSPNGEAKQKALMLKLFGYASGENYKDAIKVADKILNIDGDTETAAMVKQYKGQLEKQ